MSETKESPVAVVVFCLIGFVASMAMFATASTNTPQSRDRGDRVVMQGGREYCSVGRARVYGTFLKYVRFTNAATGSEIRGRVSHVERNGCATEAGSLIDRGVEGLGPAHAPPLDSEEPSPPRALYPAEHSAVLTEKRPKG